MICTSCPILFGWSNREEWDGRGMYHVWGRGEAYTGFWWGKPRKRDHLEDPSVDGRIILTWIFRSGMWGHGLDRCGSGYGQMAGTCEWGNEPSGSIKCGEFLKKDSAPWSKKDGVANTISINIHNFNQLTNDCEYLQNLFQSAVTTVLRLSIIQRTSPKFN